MIQVAHPRSGPQIRILVFYPSCIPDPGVKKGTDPGSQIPYPGVKRHQIPIRNTGCGSGSSQIRNFLGQVGSRMIVSNLEQLYQIWI
jgi:hypothetical protein